VSRTLAPIHLGLDVHKDTISVAILAPTATGPTWTGFLMTRSQSAGSLARRVRKLAEGHSSPSQRVPGRVDPRRRWHKSAPPELGRTEGPARHATRASPPSGTVAAGRLRGNLPDL
jgi:hypothetical protein